MRRASGALVGDGGDTGGLGGDGPGPGSAWRNDAIRDAIGVALKDFASVRSTLGPATNMACPSQQQLVHVTFRCASDEPCNDAVVVAVAAGSVDTGEP